MNTASDQVALLAVALPTFVTAVQRASPDISAGFDPMQGLRLVPDAGGNAWVVTQVAGPLAAGAPLADVAGSRHLRPVTAEPPPKGSGFDLEVGGY